MPHTRTHTHTHAHARAHTHTHTLGLTERKRRHTGPLLLIMTPYWQPTPGIFIWWRIKYYRKHVYIYVLPFIYANWNTRIRWKFPYLQRVFMGFFFLHVFLCVCVCVCVYVCVESHEGLEASAFMHFWPWHVFKWASEIISRTKWTPLWKGGPHSALFSDCHTLCTHAQTLLTTPSWLAWNWLCRPGWTPAHRDLLVSTSTSQD